MADEDGRPEGPDRTPPPDGQGSRAAAAARIQQQQSWVDLQVRRAMERGAFDNLPGAGKPIEGLGEEHDPDWWLKKLVEREKIVVLPPSLALRKEDAELDERLDRLASEADVRREVEDFNERVIRARYTPSDGPPLITMPRDVDATVDGWRKRREARRTAARARAATTGSEPGGDPGSRGRRRRWWNRH